MGRAKAIAEYLLVSFQVYVNCLMMCHQMQNHDDLGKERDSVLILLYVALSFLGVHLSATMVLQQITADRQTQTHRQRDR